MRQAIVTLGLILILVSVTVASVTDCHPNPPGGARYVVGERTNFYMDLDTGQLEYSESPIRCWYAVTDYEWVTVTIAGGQPLQDSVWVGLSDGHYWVWSSGGWHYVQGMMLIGHPDIVYDHGEPVELDGHE